MKFEIDLPEHWGKKLKYLAEHYGQAEGNLLHTALIEFVGKRINSLRDYQSWNRLIDGLDSEMDIEQLI